MAMRGRLPRLKKSLTNIVAAGQGLRLYGWVGRIVGKGIRIREASRSDWDEVYAILSPGAVDPPPPGANVTDFVATFRGRVIGHVQLVHAEQGSGLPEGLWLFGLWVRTRFRRMGVGELLSLRVMEAARERGARELYLMLFDDNAPAVRLYQKLGFTPRNFPGLEERFIRDERVSGRKHMAMAASLQDAPDKDGV